MKLGLKICVLTACLIALMGAILGLASAASAATDMDTVLRHGDVVTVATALQRDFSEFLVEQTGALDWSQIDGVAGSDTNTARMTELKQVTPLAMIVGTAYDLTRYLGSDAYTGTFYVVSPDRAACLIGALTKGFGLKYTVHFAQDEMNTLQAWVYTQFDNPSASIAQARQQLTGMTAWPKGVGGFQLGLEKGFTACGLTTQTV